jgi:hypothetical protein
MIHVASSHFKYFRCFRGMLQEFHTDVAKVDHDVAYVAIVVHICCKSLSPMFHLFFRCMLQVCLYGCCIYFHTYVASVLSIYYVCLQWFLSVLTNVSDAYFKCFICLFFCMLQVLHPKILKIDRV